MKVWLRGRICLMLLTKTDASIMGLMKVSWRSVTMCCAVLESFQFLTGVTWWSDHETLVRFHLLCSLLLSGMDEEFFRKCCWRSSRWTGSYNCCVHQTDSMLFFLHRGSRITKEHSSLVIEWPPRNPCAVASTFFIELSWDIRNLQTKKSPLEEAIDRCFRESARWRCMTGMTARWGMEAPWSKLLVK